jgi:hypothetical protein
MYREGGSNCDAVAALQDENQRLVDLMNDAIDACEDAGRPEGELLVRSVKALVAESNEFKKAARWLYESDGDMHSKLDALARWPWLEHPNEDEEEE